MFLSTLLFAIFSLGLFIRVNAQLNLTSTYISSISYGGTGCGLGSMQFFSKVLGPDTTISAFLLDPPLTAGVGGNSGQLKINKKCQMSIGLSYSSTVQLGILNTSYSGFAAFEAGSSGSMSQTEAFSGSTVFTPQVSATHTFRGPVTEDFDLGTQVAVKDIAWSTCGSPLPLNVNTQLSMTTPNSSVSATVEMAGAQLLGGAGGFTFTFLWRRCA